jgi:cobalt-zinc-cadmium resistance protein CzcA
MLKRAYVPTVDFALARPKLTIAAAAGVTVVGLGLGGHAGRGLPAADLRGGLGRRCLASPSTSLSQAIALGRETEIAPRESPEVATVINRIGRPARIGHKQQVEAAEPTASEGASI